MRRRLLVAAIVTLGASVAARGADSAAMLTPPSYSAEQADRGAAVYVERCAGCHGSDLDNGQFAAPLKGPAFHQHWSSGSLAEPYLVMIRQMPPDEPGGLEPETYADLLAFILRSNSVPAGEAALPTDPDALDGMAAP